jgi:HD-GYP domain-containing protein (c-di-GMP phosphodiesterase class II)
LIQIRRGALLHDIGKMGIPDEILRKPGTLSDQEWVIMRKHVEYAYALLSPIEYLQKAMDIPYCHHERWNGNGYPRGFKGEEIPIPARIFAVIDVWDALLSDRPYRSAWARDKVIEYMKEQAGIQFDPKIVEVFMEMVEKGEFE